jgi:hypothetical protein
VRARVFFCLLPAVAFLGGCYDAPLGPAKAPFDSRLVGDWRCIGFQDNDEPGGTLRIALSDATHADVSCVKGCEGEEFGYRLHLTKLRSVPLLNAQELKDGGPSGSWYFVRYTFHRPNLLHFEFVHDEALKGVPETSEALRSALEKRLGDPKTFEDYLVCVKAGAPAESR